MYKFFAAALLVSTTFAVKLAEDMEPTTAEVNAFIDTFVDEADKDFDGMIDRDEAIDAAVELGKMIADMEGDEFNSSDEDEARDMAAADWDEEFSEGDMLRKEDVKEFAKEEAAAMDSDDWRPEEEKPAEKKPKGPKPAELAQQEKPAEKKPKGEKPAQD